MSFRSDWHEALVRVSATQWALLSASLLTLSTLTVASLRETTGKNLKTMEYVLTLVTLGEIVLWFWASRRFYKMYHRQPQLVPVMIYGLSVLAWLILWKLINRDLTAYYSAMAALVGGVLVALVLDGRAAPTKSE